LIVSPSTINGTRCLLAKPTLRHFGQPDHHWSTISLGELQHLEKNLTSP
jgi:hypothetical protein